ncbi:sugar transferase [Aquihabitans sp. G128]|uniref:sugar transferase n=1 Tax=Aquihabitans sp. G128 TaxID=2849779 RepID=UPI001C20FBBF|nr:sugar transferase [Aquihabitans sp. G128]QXC61340.1 sugar transferase [Aquihabitans sp. G128]
MQGGQLVTSDVVEADVSEHAPAPRASRQPRRRRRSSAPAPWRPKLVMIGADAAALIVTALLSVLLFDWWDPTAGSSRNELLWSTLATLPVWLGLFANQRLYNTRFIGRRIDEFRRIVNATLLGTLSVSLVANLAGVLLRRSSLVILALVACLTVTIEREVARRTFQRLRQGGRMVRYVVVAGANPEGRDIAAMLKAEPWLGYEVIGFVDDTAPAREPVPGVPLLGGFGDIQGVLQEYPNASVIVATSGVESTVTNRLARDLLDQGVHVELSSTLRDISSQRLTVRPLGRFPIVYVEPVTRGGWRAAAKRSFDVVAAAIGLVLTAPIALVAAIAIKLDSRGPFLFSQVRVGQDSDPFPVLKFRTMVVDAEAQLADLMDSNEADGPLFKMAHDPRITRVGRFLRKTSIDELPQLWNVLRGDMSLVGPRPALPHETEEWDALLAQRLRVKPGITGMWQVSGRSDTSFEDYTRLDLYYVDNWSLATDLAILAKTIPVVLLRQGAR